MLGWLIVLGTCLAIYFGLRGTSRRSGPAERQKFSASDVPPIQPPPAPRYKYQQADQQQITFGCLAVVLVLGVIGAANSLIQSLFGRRPVPASGTPQTYQPSNALVDHGTAYCPPQGPLGGNDNPLGLPPRSSVMILHSPDLVVIWAQAPNVSSEQAASPETDKLGTRVLNASYSDTAWVGCIERSSMMEISCPYAPDGGGTILNPHAVVRLTYPASQTLVVDGPGRFVRSEVDAASAGYKAEILRNVDDRTIVYGCKPSGG